MPMHTVIKEIVLNVNKNISTENTNKHFKFKKSLIQIDKIKNAWVIISPRHFISRFTEALVVPVVICEV